MAVDVALAGCRDPGEGVLRTYRWSRPTLSFGRHQPTRGRYDGPTLERLGIGVVRRPTGGREVLHDRELTYSVAIPVRALGTLRSAYAGINAALVEALRSLGVPARMSETEDPVPALDSGACFAEPVAGEVEVEGRKLAGSAQVRIGRTLLQHGSLLLEPPTVAMGRLRHAGVSVAEILEGSVDVRRVQEALEGALAALFPGSWRRDDIREPERRVASALVPKYESSTWTWRS